MSRLSRVGCSASPSDGPDHLLLVDDVAELALAGGDGDDVARGQLVEPVEGRAVGRAVAGDGGVARLSGQGGVGVVAGALPQVGPGDALDDGLVHADAGDAEDGHRVARGRG